MKPIQIATRNALGSEKRHAEQFLSTQKGRYVLSEALYCAIALLEMAPPDQRDVEIVQHMTRLYKYVYDQFGNRRNPRDYRLLQLNRLTRDLRKLVKESRQTLSSEERPEST